MRRSTGSCRLRRVVSVSYSKGTIDLTSSLSRLDIGKGNTVGNDGVPVDVALVGRDVDTLGLSPLLEVLNRVDSGAKGGGGEKECGRESFEVE